jgi:hypothetical protein
LFYAYRQHRKAFDIAEAVASNGSKLAGQSLKGPQLLSSRAILWLSSDAAVFVGVVGEALFRLSPLVALHRQSAPAADHFQIRELDVAQLRLAAAQVAEAEHGVAVVGRVLRSVRCRWHRG